MKQQDEFEIWSFVFLYLLNLYSLLLRLYSAFRNLEPNLKIPPQMCVDWSS
jgi:hypothetical protein